MRKKTRMSGRVIAAAMAAALTVSGCGLKEASGQKEETAAVEETVETESTEETAQESDGWEEGLTPEEKELIKYNYYVELNNKIITILDDINYYYEVVEYQEEFSLIPNSEYTYGYRISGVNSDILNDCLQLADMEPAFETLDPLVKEMADPLRELMDTFSQMSRAGDYAANQYEKPKEYHSVIYAAANTFEELGYEYIGAVGEVADERIAEEEERMKAEGNLIIYNASRGISIVEDILDECRNQGVTDENIQDLDLTTIKPLYEELLGVVEDLDAATSDNEQLMKESISGSKPFAGLYDRMIQALDFMMQQVESGRPIEDPSLEPLGSLAHVSNTLSDCIDKYNSVFVD